MLDDCKTKEERWEGVQKLIERWLAERQELIVSYCSVSGVNNLTADDKIGETTEAILNFNDIFDTDEHCEQAIGRLKAELSTLGEHLTNRFIFEDQLINGLHTIHAAESA